MFKKIIFLVVGAFAAFPALAQDTIKIGLVTALSGQSARAGEAITRGLQVAIDELNAAGGVLGRKFEVGSSRVDLQACKLEYSIVSPK